MADSKSIQFKPLSEGLGFHPKLNPTPQAPSVPKLAPPPVLPHSTPAKPPVAPTDFARPHHHQHSTAAVITPMQPEVRGESLRVSESRALLIVKRVFAFLFDIVFHAALFLVGLAASLRFMGVPEDQIVPFLNTLETAAFVIFAIWMILIAQESVFHMTLGKRLFGLFLDGSSLAIVIRGLLFPLSLVLAGVGVLIALFDKRSRTLHDLLTGVRVIEIARL